MAAEPTAAKTEWTVAGRAWGERALDWAYLVEPYSRPANEVLFDQLGVSSGVRLLDIACGSGLAANHARRLGAAVSGLDASKELIDVACVRTPDADFRVGDMNALPFPDASFDVATSFNGIWKGCEGALAEARRVLTPTGRIGLTFWGRREHFGLRPFFLKLIKLSPPSHVEASVEQGDTGRVIEEMLTSTGFELQERGFVTTVNEWPDPDIAIRALAGAGPSIPAIEAVGRDAFCDAMREVIEPLYVPGVGVRLSSEVEWVTADVAPR
jgi:SAM-dependent methyltransferase